VKGRTSNVGRHLPTSGGLKKTLARVEELGCETVQVFVSNPQGWADPVLRPDAAVFDEERRRLGLWPVVAHAKYLINLASPDLEHRRRSARALALEMVAAGELGADFVVVHCGSHGGSGEREGIERLAAGLERAREMAGSLGAGRFAEPLIENPVGGGTQICHRLDSLAEAARLSEARVCVDTAHLHAAGYGIAQRPAEVVRELVEKLGPALALLHLNDARNALGSHRDGHRRIGEGHIPLASWKTFLRGLQGTPVVMETPYGDHDVDAEQIKLVKELAGGLAKVGIRG
jgi:deoxyribonuclease-4